MELKDLYPTSGRDVYHPFLDSIVVSISACHVEGPGSIPGRGVIFPVHSTKASQQQVEG